MTHAPTRRELTILAVGDGCNTVVICDNYHKSLRSRELTFEIFVPGVGDVCNVPYSYIVKAGAGIQCPLTI